jgi:hypothetical protein
MARPTGFASWFVGFLKRRSNGERKMDNASGRFVNKKAWAAMCLSAFALASHANESDGSDFQILAHGEQTVHVDVEDMAEVTPLQLSKYTVKEAPSAIPDIPQPVLSSDEQAITPEKKATAAAVADGLTTAIAVSSGAIEMNPLISTSPVGIVAITGLKYGLVKYAETFPEEDKRMVMKSTTALWGGAAVNNLLVLIAAPPPLSIIAGLITGIATWRHMDSQYEKEDQIIAARNRTKQKMEEDAMAAVVQVDSSGE